MRTLFLLGISLLIGTSILAQRTNYESPYLQKENYIPYPYSSNDIYKTIHIAFHIWQRADGSGTFKDTPETRARFDRIVGWMNDAYNKNSSPATPGVSYKVDSIYRSNIHFQLEGIYFYRDASKDSSYCYSTNYAHNVKLNDFLKKNYPERTKTLNIHFFMGQFYAFGYSTGGSIGTFNKGEIDYANDDVGDWGLSRHWAHEVGHSLDLWHTYDASNFQQNCNLNGKDFLFDIFDTTQIATDKGRCDVPFIAAKDNNNLMGGSGKPFTISALQMGIMHRTTVIENLYNSNYHMRDFVTGYGYIPKYINKDERWNISMKIYQDIIVESGVKLTINAEIQMVHQARIIIKEGAELIVDGGKITRENYYQKDWRGITLRKAKKNSNLEDAKIIYLNGGQILHAKKIK